MRGQCQAQVATKVPSSCILNEIYSISFLVMLAPNPASGLFPPTLFSVTILILAGSTAAGPQGVEVGHFNLQMKKHVVWISSTPALDGLMLKTCGSYPCCGHWSFECCVDSKIWCSSAHLFTGQPDQECCTGQQSPLFRNAIEPCKGASWGSLPFGTPCYEINAVFLVQFISLVVRPVVCMDRMYAWLCVCVCSICAFSIIFGSFFFWLAHQKTLRQKKGERKFALVF